MLAIPAVGVLPAPVATEEHCPGRGEGLGHHPLRRLREVVAVDLLEHPPRALHVLHRMNIHQFKVMFDRACFHCLGNRSENEYHLAPGPRQDERHGEGLAVAVVALALLPHDQVGLLLRMVSAKWDKALPVRLRGTLSTLSDSFLPHPVGTASGLRVGPLHARLAQPPHLGGRAAPRLEHRVHLAADDAALRARLADLHLHHYGENL